MKSKQKSAKLSLGNSSTKVKPVHKGKIKNIAQAHENLELVYKILQERLKIKVPMHSSPLALFQQIYGIIKEHTQGISFPMANISKLLKYKVPRSSSMSARQYFDQKFGGFAKDEQSIQKTEKHLICHKEPGYGKKPQPILPTIKDLRVWKNVEESSNEINS